MSNVVKFKPRPKKPPQPARQTRPAANANPSIAAGGPMKWIVLAVCVAVVVAGIFAPNIIAAMSGR